MQVLFTKFYWQYLLSLFLYIFYKIKLIKLNLELTMAQEILIGLAWERGF